MSGIPTPPPPPVIGRAAPQDAEGVSRLILSLADAFLLDPAGHGAERFLQTLAPEALCGCIASPDFLYLKAADAAGGLLGVVAVRGGTHLHHLFVRRDCQRRGLSRRLWQRARELAGTADEAWTVNASCVAVPVYERFGFSACGPRAEAMGIAFVPMRRPPPGAA